MYIWLGYDYGTRIWKIKALVWRSNKSDPQWINGEKDLCYIKSSEVNGSRFETLVFRYTSSKIENILQ